jgi:hypothetical protein
LIKKNKNDKKNKNKSKKIKINQDKPPRSSHSCARHSNPLSIPMDIIIILAHTHSWGIKTPFGRFTQHTHLDKSRQKV